MFNKYKDTVKLMIGINRLHKRAFEEEISKSGIHRTQHFILMRLSDEAKPRSQKEIAEHLGITPAAVTLALSKLEACGLIERKAGEDTRFNEISLTEKGREIVEATRASFTKIDEAAFCGITAEEKEIFDRCLKTMKKNLELISDNQKGEQKQ